MKPEDFLSNDTFLAWYFRSDDQHWSHWEQLRNTDPHLRKGMDDAVRMLEAIMAGHVNVSIDQQVIAKTTLMSRIQNWEQLQEATDGTRRIGRRAFVWMSAAASVLLVALAGFWLFTKTDKQVYYAEAGTTQHITLSDGSIIDLNGNSSLTTRLKKGKDREVWLEGEAYFKISKDADGAKFTVHTGDLEVEVLGTEFNVRGLGEKTEVVLESGKVQLSLKESSDHKVILDPGELAEFSKSSGRLTKRDVNTRIYTSWKEGKVIFENAAVDEIAQVLRERYLLDVRVEKGSILGEFNGIFPVDDAAVVLMALEKTYPGRIIVHNDSIIIKK